jgi:Rieske 2Fe-2S family protein
MAPSGALETRFNGLARAQPGLPAAWYFDPAQFDREMRGIWRRNWIYLCRADSLEGTGAFRTFQVAGQELMLVRDEAGVIQGYFNTCRHRGSILCEAEAGRLKRPLIVCPYHQWAYGLDGRLRATGPMRRVGGFDRADHGLHRIAVAEWGGFVFANMAGAAAAPFLDQSGAELSFISVWPMADLVVGHRYRKVLNCNWKIFWENFNECLHCPNIHPELCELVPIYGRAIMARRDDPDWQARASERDPRVAGGLREGAETWSMDGRAQGMLPGLTEAERAPGQRYATVLPSAFIVAHLDYVRIVRILPLTPEKMELSAEWLFHPEMLARPGFDKARITDFATLVLDQDGAACELNQRGLKAVAFERGVLMQEEYEVFLFQDWVREQLGEPRLGGKAASRASRRAE